MLHRSFPVAVACSVIAAALLSAGALAQTDIGLLPFRARPPEVYYAHVVLEDLGDESRAPQPSHRRAYCKRSDSPGSASCYYLDTAHPAWLSADLEVPSVLYASPTLPTAPLDVFYANYQIRIHGVGEVAERSCFLVSIISRTSRQPVIDLCVDRTTGLSLQTTNYDMYGKAIYRSTYLEFDTDPDVSGIEFPTPPWTVIQIPSTDLTPDELTALLPWLRLPTWLPGNFQLLAIQYWHSETPDGQEFYWHGTERVQIVYTDGLRNINITAMAPVGATKVPERSDFSESPDDGDDNHNVLPSLSASGPYLLVASHSDRISKADLYRVLWSMLPPDPDDVSPAVETKPKHTEVLGGHDDAL